MKHSYHSPTNAGNKARTIVFSLLQTSAIVALSWLATACGLLDSGSGQAKLDELEKVTLSAELQTIYSQTCANCHESSATGAPVTGDTERWQVVFNKPFDIILSRVVEGYGGMPPLGQCFQCSADQLGTLIHYMSRPADRQP